MKKIGLEVKEKIIAEVTDKAKTAEACLFINFNKAKAFSLNVMRNNLAVLNSKIYVAKNTLLKKAFSNIGLTEFNEFLASETGIVFVYDKDVVKSCKTLIDFLKTSEGLQVSGGFLKDKKISKADVEALAKLPAKEVLLANAVGAIAAPLSGFINTLNQIPVKFLWVVEEIKKTKDKQ